MILLFLFLLLAVPACPDGWWMVDGDVCFSNFPCCTPLSDYDRSCTVDLRDFAHFQSAAVGWWNARVWSGHQVSIRDYRLTRFARFMESFRGPAANRCRQVAAVEWMP